MPTLRLLPWVALSIATSGCLAIIDFDEYKGGSSGAGGAPMTSSGGTSSAMDGGGGSGGTGGAGGGEVCTLPGDGLAAAAEPWSLVLGPIDAFVSALGVERAFTTKVELAADKLVFGVSSFGNDGPLTLQSKGAGTVSIAGSENDAFIVGWADDEGVVPPQAWVLGSLAPVAGPYGSSIDIARWKPGRVLVVVADGASRALLIDLDLCTREERVLADCEGSANSLLREAFVDADPEADRFVFSINQVGGVALCEFSADLPDCPVPNDIDTVIFAVDGAEPGGTCLAQAIPGASVVSPELSASGQIVMTGDYRLSLFGSGGIETKCAGCNGDPTCLDTSACNSNPTDGFFARIDVSGSGLDLVQAVDLGAGVNAQDVLPIDDGSDDVVVAFSAFPRLPFPPFPDAGWVFPYPDTTTTNGSDIVIARIPPSGTVEWEELISAGSYETTAQLTRSAGGLLLAGRTAGPGSGVISGCPDQMVPDPAANGCAFFLPLSEAGVAEKPLFINTDGGAWGGDDGYAGWIMADADLLVAGAVDGTLSLDTGYEKPPVGKLNLFLARVPAP